VTTVPADVEFYDAWAAETPLESVCVRECFEAPTATENQFILRRMGSLAGKRLLDIGAGLGESSVYFAKLGAAVTLVDISPAMVNLALRLGRCHGVELEGMVGNIEELNLPEDSFDIVYIANTVHHIRNRRRLFQQIQRTLKPGGRFFSCDPLAYNPVIWVYRCMARRVRTPDEAPLTRSALELAREYFVNVGHREFWIAGLLLFLKYYLIERIHPNDDRYWKRILRETPESLWWWMPLRKLDEVLTRLPGVRWLAWNMVMWGQKS